MAIQDVAQACEIFKTAVKNKDKTTALNKLNELKESVLKFDSFAVSLDSPTSLTERKIVRDFFEYAVIFSVDCGDSESFQKYLSSLRPFYTSANTSTPSANLPDSELICTILGLNLLHLLVENKLSQFHSELELLTSEQQQHPAVTFCTQLDQHLMVGSYDQVLSAAEKPPVEYYTFFLKSLMRTVRVNIGECAAASYVTLTVQAATKILMFSSSSETLNFISEMYPDWTIANEIITLKNTKSVSKSDDIPSLKLITQQLTYASELERIV